MPLFDDYDEEMGFLRTLGWNDNQIRKYAVDENGQISRRVQHNPWATAGFSALRGAPAALTGTLSGVAAGAIPAVAATPAAGVATGLAVGIPVAAATDAAVGAMLPKSWTYALKESQFQNPKAAFGGSVASAAAGGYGASPRILKAGIQGLPRAFSRYGAAMGEIDPIAQAGRNLVTQTGIGAALPYASAGLSEAFNEDTHGVPYLERVNQDVGMKDILASMATMALANRPIKPLRTLAPKIFHDPLPGIERASRAYEVGGDIEAGRTGEYEWMPEDAPVTEKAPVKEAPAKPDTSKFGEDNPFVRVTRKEYPKGGKVAEVLEPRISDQQILNWAKKFGIELKTGEDVKNIREELAGMFEQNRGRTMDIATKKETVPKPAPGEMKEGGMEPIYTPGTKPRPFDRQLEVADIISGLNTKIEQENALARFFEGQFRAQKARLNREQLQREIVPEAKAEDIVAGKPAEKEAPLSHKELLDAGLNSEAAKRLEGMVTQDDLRILAETLQKRQITGKTGEQGVRVEGKDFQPADEPIPSKEPERAVNAPETEADRGIMGAFLELARLRGIGATGHEGPLLVKRPDGSTWKAAGEYDEGPHAMRVSDVAAETGPHETLHPILKNILRKMSPERKTKLEKMFSKETKETGLSLEEYLATRTGRDVIRRIGEKDFGMFNSIISSLKESFGLHNQHDVIRLLGDVSTKGGRIAKPPPEFPEDFNGAGARPGVSPTDKQPLDKDKGPPYGSEDYLQDLRRKWNEAMKSGTDEEMRTLAEEIKKVRGSPEHVKSLRDLIKKADDVREALMEQFEADWDVASKTLMRNRAAGMSKEEAQAEFNRMVDRKDHYDKWSELFDRSVRLRQKLREVTPKKGKDYQPLDKPQGDETPSDEPGRPPYGSDEHLKFLEGRIAQIRRQYEAYAKDTTQPGHKEFYDDLDRINARLKSDPTMDKGTELINLHERMKDNPFIQSGRDLMDELTALDKDLKRAKTRRAIGDAAGRPPKDPGGIHYQLISKVGEGDKRVIRAEEILKEHPALKSSEVEKYTGVFKKSEDKVWREFLGGPAHEMFVGRPARPGDKVRNFVTKRGMKAFEKLPAGVREQVLEMGVYRGKGSGAVTEHGKRFIRFGTEGLTPREISELINHEVQHVLQRAQGTDAGADFDVSTLTADQKRQANAEARLRYKEKHGRELPDTLVGGERNLQPEFKEMYDRELENVSPEFRKYRQNLGERESRMAASGKRDADYQLIYGGKEHEDLIRSKKEADFQKSQKPESLPDYEGYKKLQKTRADILNNKDYPNRQQAFDENKAAMLAHPANKWIADFYKNQKEFGRQQAEIENYRLRNPLVHYDKEGKLIKPYPEDKDYQPFSSPLKGEVDKIEDTGIKKGVREAFEQRPFMAGKLIKVTRPLKKFDPAVVEKITDLHNRAYHGHSALPPMTGDRRAISDILKKYSAATQAELSAVGLAGRRHDPMHVPNILSPDAIDVLHTGGADARALQTAIEAEFVRNGATPAKAKQAAKTIAGRRTLHRDQQLGLQQDFTLPSGRKIKVRDPFPYDRYSRLLASDIQWQRYVKTPATGRGVGPLELSRDPAVRTSQRSYYGEYDRSGGLFKAYNRLAGAGFLQAWTGLKDFATTLPSARREGFSYSEIAEGLGNIVKGRQSAIDKELIREEPYMIGANPRTGTRHERWVNNAADTLYKISGRKMSDDWARAWAQGIADAGGRPEAAQYIAGIYDARELPKGLMEPGLLGEALRINRWSVSTANRLVKAGKGPDGAVKIGEAFLLSLGVGAGFDYLRKKWTGLVKSRPELADLKATGADNKHYVAWLSDLLQKGSFAGMYGDIVNGLVQSYVRGDNSKLQAFLPLANAAKSSFEKFTDVTRAALDDGQDPMKAIAAGVNEATKDVIQNYRMIHDKFLLEPEEKARRAEGRDLNVFRELTQDQRPGSYEAPNVAEGAAEREFKREMDPDKAIAQLDVILKRYTAEFGNKPERLIKKLNALARNKTSIPAGMIELSKYYDYLTQKDGRAAADQRIEDLYYRRELNRAKSQAVPTP